MSQSEKKESKISIAMVASILAAIVSFLGIIAFLISTFVTKSELQAEHDLRVQELLAEHESRLQAVKAERETRLIHEEYIQKQFVDLAEKILEKQDYLAQNIKDAKAFSLVVRRDVLLHRDHLTTKEISELRLIIAKLTELNVNSGNPTFPPVKDPDKTHNHT